MLSGAYSVLTPCFACSSAILCRLIASNSSSAIFYNCNIDLKVKTGMVYRNKIPTKLLPQARPSLTEGRIIDVRKTDPTGSINQ